MPNTPNRAYTYPDSGGSDRLWEHFQELATDIDTDINTLAGRINTPPMCRVKLSGSPTVSIATGGAFLSWDTNVFDPLGWHSTSVNPTRITPNIPGWYEIKTNVQFASQAGGRRWTAQRQNGSSPLTIFGNVILAATTGNLGVTLCTDPVLFNGSTDYFEVTAGQDSGSTIAIGDYGSTGASIRLLYRT